MNDPDNFLSRWSRRKREAGAQPEKCEAAAQPEKTDSGEASTSSVRGGEGIQDKPGSEPAAPLPIFGASNLPPIDSIGANTDISAFMQKGVPSALRHAALRRAWSADPAIRDFMGPTENYWDAPGPDGISGFGPLDPKLDIKRMVSELLGDTTPERKQPDPPDSLGVSASSVEKFEGGYEDDKPVKSEPSPVTTDDNLSHRTENAAPQNQSPRSGLPQKTARRHGGAIPE